MSKAQKEKKIPKRVQRIVDACRGGADALPVYRPDKARDLRRPLVPAPLEQGGFTPQRNGSLAASDPPLRRAFRGRHLTDVGSVTP